LGVLVLAAFAGLALTRGRRPRALRARRRR